MKFSKRNFIDSSSYFSSNFGKKLLVVLLITFLTRLNSVKTLKAKTLKGVSNTKELLEEHPQKDLSNFGILT